ncbi:MAG: dihydropteroate synthase [Betaproteobacteria bacterium]
MSHWQTSRFQIELSRPQVMGIVNLTPDSFSGDGQLGSQGSVSAALAHCEQLLREGADLLDLGAESSRPGAPSVPAQEELQRLLPVLREALRLGVPISVDTCKPQVMRAVLDAGVDIINDIWALRQSGALEVVAGHGTCGVCLMHMHREPQTMQAQPMTGQALPQVRAFLQGAAERVRSAGVAAERIVLDPGVGFGKTVAQNLEMLAHQSALLALGYPLVAAWSRKSSLGAVMSAGPEPVPVTERLPGSLAAALLAVERGASIVRVHDVRETVGALSVWQAVR